MRKSKLSVLALVIAAALIAIALLLPGEVVSSRTAEVQEPQPQIDQVTPGQTVAPERPY